MHVHIDDDDDDMSEAKLDQAKAWIVRYGCVFSLLIAVVWPLLTLAAGNFSLSFFRFWIIISFLWSLLASIVIIALPLIESRIGVGNIIMGCLKSLVSFPFRRNFMTLMRLKSDSDEFETDIDKATSHVDNPLHS